MPRSTKPTLTEADQRTIDDYMEATGETEINMRRVAEWGIAEGRYHHPPADPVREYAKRLSRSAREEQYTDPQGREVRKKHCFVYVDETGQRRWRWVDITTAEPDKMRMAFQQRRQGLLADAVQHRVDVQSYNDNNKYGVQLEFDYNLNEDLAELDQPDEYPEEG